MRILVLTLMMSFLSHSAFGAAEGGGEEFERCMIDQAQQSAQELQQQKAEEAEEMEQLIQQHNRLRELHRKAQAEIQFLHMDETLRQMEKDSIWILTLQIEIYLRLKTLS
jgi:membrane protein involved in colicin uptake